MTACTQVPGPGHLTLAEGPGFVPRATKNGMRRKRRFFGENSSLPLTGLPDLPGIYLRV